MKRNIPDDIAMMAEETKVCQEMTTKLVAAHCPDNDWRI